MAGLRPDRGRPRDDRARRGGHLLEGTRDRSVVAAQEARPRPRRQHTSWILLHVGNQRLSEGHRLAFGSWRRNENAASSAAIPPDPKVNGASRETAEAEPHQRERTQVIWGNPTFTPAIVGIPDCGPTAKDMRLSRRRSRGALFGGSRPRARRRVTLETYAPLGGRPAERASWRLRTAYALPAPRPVRCTRPSASRSSRRRRTVRSLTSR